MNEVSDKETSYEELLKLKRNKYSSALSFKKCYTKLEDFTKRHLKQRFLRRKEAKREESEQIVVGQVHLYHVIDSQTDLIQDYYPETFGVAVAFESKYDKTEDGFSVVVEVKSDVNEEAYSYLVIKYYLHKRHQLYKKKPYVFSKETLEKYLKGDSVSRFCLRDDIVLEKINS